MKKSYFEKAKLLFACIALLTLSIGCTNGEVKKNDNKVGNDTTLNSKTTLLYPVKVNGQYGYMDKSGKMAIKPQFDFAEDFSEGYAAVGKNIVVTQPSEGKSGTMDVKFGYINEKGEVVIKQGFFSAGSFKNGIAPVSMRKNDGGKSSIKFGHIDNKGDFVISPQFSYADNFSNDLAKVSFDSPLSLSQKIGFIDKTGKMVIEPEYAYLSEGFSEGLACVITGDSYKYIDTGGKDLFNKEYPYAEGFSDGLAVVQVDNNYGYINKKGEVAISPQFTQARRFSEGVAAVEVLEGEASKWSLVNNQGKVTAIEIGADISEMGEMSEGLIKYKEKDTEKWGFVDKNGKVIVKAQYDDVSNFSNGIAKVSVNGELSRHDCKYGYIDNKGNYVWEPTE